MAIVCPTVTAYDINEFNSQLTTAARLSSRVHVDLMDGIFTSTKSPSLANLKIPSSITVDIHLMFQNPMEQLQALINLRPNMVIVQAEAEVHHMHFVAELHKADIKVGLCILQDTPVDNIQQIMHSFDHILVFSGKLGHHGGIADLKLLEKVYQIQSEFSDVEIGWDGGINDENTQQLVDAGVDVFNVGGYIQKATDPKVSYDKIVDLLR